MLDLIKDHFRGFPGELAAFGLLLVSIPLAALAISACATDKREVQDPKAALIEVDGQTVRILHPSEGVTCYVMHGTGISCLKD